MRLLCLLLLVSAGCSASRLPDAPAPSDSTHAASLDLPPIPPAPPCQHPVCVDKREDALGVRLLATNHDTVAQYVTFTLTLDNMQALGEAPYLTVVPPGETVTAVRILRADRTQPWRYRYRYRWRPAIRTAELLMYSNSVHTGPPDAALYYRGDSARVVVDLVNGLRAPQTVAVWAEDSTYAPLTPNFVVEPMDTVRVFDGRPPPGWMDVPEREALFLSMRAALGRPGVEAPDSTARYVLPTPSGDTLRVLASSSASVTFGGGRIAAARAGTLVQIVDGTAYRPDAARMVLVLHDDGTFGRYQGHVSGTVTAPLGARLEAGDALAGGDPDGWTFTVEAHAAVGQWRRFSVCLQTREGEVCTFETDYPLVAP
jgi:hypothetical protein